MRVLLLLFVLFQCDPAYAADCVGLDRAQQRLFSPMLAAEREFARVAAVDFQRAYLAAIEPQSITVEPYRTDAESWLEQLSNTAVLEWNPAQSAISAAGDFGYSFGSVNGQDLDHEQAIAGSYLNVWQRSDESQPRWQLLAHQAIAHAQTPSRRFRHAHCRSLGELDLPLRGGHAQRMDALKWSEEHLSATSYAVDSWILHSGKPPRSGAGKCRLPMARTRLSRGGDMGFTAGADSAQGSFLRVWRFDRNLGWRIEVELCSRSSAQNKLN